MKAHLELVAVTEVRAYILGPLVSLAEQDAAGLMLLGDFSELF
jgi:hypothetical protein